jgi:hypothetical protein
MMAIRVYPKTLLDRQTQKIVLKFLLKRILSPKIANYLLIGISKTRATAIRNFNDEKAFIS